MPQPASPDGDQYDPTAAPAAIVKTSRPPDTRSSKILGRIHLFLLSFLILSFYRFLHNMQSSSENIKNCFIYYLFDDTLKEKRFIGGKQLWTGS